MLLLVLSWKEESATLCNFCKITKAQREFRKYTVFLIFQKGKPAFKKQDYLCNYCIASSLCLW